MMKSLAVLALTFGVGASTIGCSGASTPTAPLSSTISTTVQAHALVDVDKVWAEHPLPDCPKPPLKRNDGQVPAGLELPTESTVSDILGDVKSPGSEPWVRRKLSWVTQALLAVRADIITYNGTAGGDSQLQDFKNYVEHVKIELAQGQDIDSPLDLTYPEACQ
ncbi:Uncharacterised protein [Mycobacteroides abscessus subsp. abscessus]|uniref:hypothetical protein n=2 Tax=Mycobacteroides abscessus TaxID=36809 RepID=UPI0003A9EC6E|nr:hypothetical protein [Mycobacteroides abscessus]CPS15582.1 Uncharacterised protein [Mycobacteroides abscessus]CPS52005.1 Uncharacterised protein [Mycobacteroides abscessus]CPS88468.1 Uncharacterised protein [Mycobacteroides abscessus]CPU30586.1 Uncharacterised protein [Mycobacteroides abscessus]CPV19125.1 Uncharacterised protein [Mycobacteroides abscessus]